MRSLIVATGNPGKLQEMQAYLTGTDWHLQLKPAHLEVEETGQTFAENARLKASEVAKATGEWAIADDSGLMVNALGGSPGIYSARYGKTDVDRINRLLKALGNTGDRDAQFVCVLAISCPDGAIACQAEGICPGEILYQPRGDNGFGYDPIFYFPEQGMTFAEMSPNIKHQYSHRALAFAALLPQLDGLFH